MPIHCLLFCFSNDVFQFVVLFHVFILVATPVGTQFRGQGVMGVVPGSSSKCELFIFCPLYLCFISNIFCFKFIIFKILLGVPSSSKKQVTFGLAVSLNDLSQPYYLFHKAFVEVILLGNLLLRLCLHMLLMM